MPKDIWTTTAFRLRIKNNTHVCMRLRDHFSQDLIMVIVICLVAALASCTYGFFASRPWATGFAGFMWMLALMLEGWGWKMATKRYAVALVCAVEGAHAKETVSTGSFKRGN